MSSRSPLSKFVEYGSGIAAGLSGVGCNFLIQLALTRYLGAAGFGQFALWRNNVQLGAGLGGLSINTLSLKMLAVSRDRLSPAAINRYRRNASLLVILASLVLAMLLALLLTPPRFPLTVSVGASAGLALLALWAACHRALHGGSVAIFAERALQPFVFLLCVLGATVGFFEEDVEGFAWWFLGVTGLALGAVLILAYVYRRDAGRGNENAVEIANPKRILLSAVPFFLVSVSGVLSARTPLIFGGFLLSNAELGQLAFMISLAGLVSVIMFTTNLVAGPKIANAYGRGDSYAARAEVAIARWIVLGLGVAAALAIWFTVPLFGLITGDATLIVRPVLALLLIANIANVLLAVPALYLQMTDRQKALALISNLAVGLKIAALYPLGRSYGLTGFAVAEIVQALANGVAVGWIYRRISRRPA